MLRKLFIAVALVAVGAASYGVARAYFTSITPAESSASFTAGSININVGPHNGYNAVPFELSNWMPGDTQKVVFDINNTSTVPVTLAGEVSGTWGEELGDTLVYVTAVEYWDGANWQNMATTGHGTFTYANASTPSTLLQVPAGGAATVRMTAEFDESADNKYQGKTYTANLSVTASQVR